MLSFQHTLRTFPLEALLWTTGLVALIITNPEGEPLLELCLFKWIGLPRCPGCGLGHAVAYLFRGEWLLSFQAHPLGIPAVAILTGRIGTLVRQSYQVPPPS